MKADILHPLPQDTTLLPSDTWDTRSDEEIVAQLNTFVPVTSTKNVWAFWNTGWDSMRPWCKRNVIGWVRRQSQDWTVRVLDRVEGSPNNVYNFLNEQHLPRAFRENTMEGAYVGAHMADLVRLPCLYEYGGIWLDVSIMLFRSLEDICWTALTDPTTPFEIGGFVLPDNHKGHQMECGYMENWFIASATAHNPFILRWYTVFLKYWEDSVESQNAKHHPLFLHLDTEGFRQDMIDYLAQHLSFQRVRTLIDNQDDWNGPDYYRSKMYLLDARKEAYFLPCKTKWKGQRCFDILACKRSNSDASESTVSDGSESDAESESEEIARHMVANCCLMKSVHGFKGDTQLSDIWNQPEHHHADIAPGTYAEYLSAASLYLQQKRPLKTLVVDEKASLEEPLLKARLLEPAKCAWISA